MHLKLSVSIEILNECYYEFKTLDKAVFKWHLPSFKDLYERNRDGVSEVSSKFLCGDVNW